MKKIKLLLLFIFVMTVSFNNSEAQVANDSERTPTSQVIVSYKTESAMNADRIKLKKYNPIKVSDISKTLLLKYPTVLEAQNEVEKFKLRSDVAFAFNDEILYAAVVPYATPNDPAFGSQYYLTKCKFDLAWDLVKGDGSILVGVVDTGFETTGHVDITNVKLPGYNGLDGTSNTQPDNFPNMIGPPHGTQVSGLVTATTNNSVGISSGSWNAKLLPMKAALGGGGLTMSSNAVLKCFEYADRNNVKVLNASMTGTDGDGPLATKVIPYYDKGLIFVGAAGNANKETLNTSKYVIRVGALDPDDKKASFSNFGIGVDIYAPGVSLYTTTLGNKYDPKFGGTSGATPIVSSLVVLLKTINPAYKTSDIKNILKRTATDLSTPGWDKNTGWGRINAYDAVRYAKGIYNPVDQFPPVVLVPAVNDKNVYKDTKDIIINNTFTILIAADDNFGLEKVEIFLDNIKVHTFTNFDFSALIYPLITRNFSNGLHTVKAIATDINGYTSESSTNINIQNVIDNNPPVINFLTPNPNSVLNGSFTASVTASDDDSIEKVDFYIDDIFVQSVPKLFYQQNIYSITIDTNKYSTGNKVLKAVTKDPSNNVSETSITVKFTDEVDTTPPTLLITSPQTLTLVRENIQITYIARDNRGISKFNLYRNNVFVKSTLNPSIITDSLTSLKNGDYTYYVEAIDLNGNIGRSLPIVLRKR